MKTMTSRSARAPRLMTCSATLLSCALFAGCGGEVPDNQATSPESAIASTNDAVSIARKFVGQASWDVHLKYYTDAGGETNNCADFVSAVLENAGMIIPSQIDQTSRINVCDFQTWLKGHQWSAVSKADSKAGDVWLACVPGQLEHTVLVSQAGGGDTIGSDGSAQEYIREEPMPDSPPYSEAKYYHKD